MPSFDIVSEVAMNEVQNAVENANRELQTRFDFRGVDASFELNKEEIKMAADADFQLKQMIDFLRPIMFCKIVSSIFRSSKCNRHRWILKFFHNAFCNRSSLSRLATGSIANAQPHQNYKYKCLFHFVIVLIGNVFSKVMK